MSNTLRWFFRSAPLLACFLVAGCAGGPQAVASYNTNTNLMTYETGPYTVASSSGASYGGSKAIEMRAVARCRGSDCTPDLAKLIFLVSGGEMALSGTSGKITADGTVVKSWTSPDAAVGLPTTVSNAVDEVAGKFAAVEVRLDKLRRIATASSVKGSIGGMSLRFGANVQSGLQAMLQKIEQGAEASSSPTE